MKPLIATVFLFALATSTNAQFAKIAGIVVDPQPARIAQAKVLAEAKGVKKEFITDDEGFFQGTLEPGWYVITVSHNGFETRKFELELKPDQVTALNVTLKLPTLKCPKGQVCDE